MLSANTERFRRRAPEDSREIASSTRGSHGPRPCCGRDGRCRVANCPGLHPARSGVGCCGASAVTLPRARAQRARRRRHERPAVDGTRTHHLGGPGVLCTKAAGCYTQTWLRGMRAFFRDGVARRPGCARQRRGMQRRGRPAAGRRCQRGGAALFCISKACACARTGARAGRAGEFGARAQRRHLGANAARCRAAMHVSMRGAVLGRRSRGLF